MYKSILLLGFLLLSVMATMQAQTLRVATYNIRYDATDDTLNAWSKRLPVMVDLIRFHQFDIFGTQEGLHHQLQGLAAGLPDYEYIGVGREDGKQKGEFAAIFYNKNKYKLLRKGTFWLSQTPDKPSTGWDAALPRVCTWGQFNDKTSGLSFYLFNVHFDHKGEQARQQSAKLVLSKIKEIAGASPVIFTGDFNFGQQNENYTLLNSSGLLKDAYQLADIRFAPNGTFNSFDINRKSDERIDHIFLSSGFDVPRYGILTETYNDGKYPSDHFPVLLEVKYTANK